MTTGGKKSSKRKSGFKGKRKPSPRAQASEERRKQQSHDVSAAYPPTRIPMKGPPGRRAFRWARDVVIRVQEVAHTNVLLSNKAYYAALKDAYGVFWDWCQIEDPDQKAEALEALGQLGKNGRRRTYGSDPARTILRAVINYADADNRASGAIGGRWRVPRDANALEYARETEIPPDDFVERLMETGEGLSRWAKRIAQKRREAADQREAKGRAIEAMLARSAPRHPPHFVLLPGTGDPLEKPGTYALIASLNDQGSRVEISHIKHLAATQHDPHTIEWVETCLGVGAKCHGRGD